MHLFEKTLIYAYFSWKFYLQLRLATHPFSNSIRAFAISGVSEITEIPLACTFFTLRFNTDKNNINIMNH